MKITFNKQQWEYNPKMTVSDFTEANEDNIAVSYQEEFPSLAYKINDGDIDHLRDWVQENVEYYKEIMVELYSEYLSIDDIVTSTSVITEKDRRSAAVWLSDPDNSYDIMMDDLATEWQREVLSMKD